MKRLILFFFFLILISTSGYSQDLSEDFKNWYILGVNARINSKSTLKLSRLNSYDVRPYRQGFNQTSLGFARRANKKWEWGTGYAFSTIIGTARKTNYHRISGFVSHRSRYGKLRMKNTIQAEKYFPRLQKFGARLVFTNKWTFHPGNWPLKMTPYIRNQLYYYQGGDPITYWLDEDDIEISEEGESEEFIRQAPNGLHRYRFTLGVRSKLSKELALSLFFMRQVEFNTGWAPYRELNVYNQSMTRIKRPFNNYSLIGISLNYTFKTY